MAEAGLSMGYGDFLASLGRYLGWSRTYSGWTAQQLSRAEEIMSAGLRQFYAPPPIDGRARPDMVGYSHQWNFLKPVTTLDLESGTSDYDLPDDFGSIVGTFTFGSSVAPSCRIEVTSEGRIREFRDVADLSDGRPKYCAIRPKATDGSTGQRFEVLFYPAPDEDYELTYAYKPLLGQLSSGNPYPYGGQDHAQTIEASILAVAELQENDERGLQWDNFMTLLSASVVRDQQLSARSLGYMGDPAFFRSGGQVTINNVPLSTYNGSVPT